MYLKSVFVRFYKSFNFDYMRKFHKNAVQRPWESYRHDGLWFPFVTIPLDRSVTTVVGANESGKSQLLSAIEKGISGIGIERSDFCRYSQFFTVEQDKMGWPEFGFEWSLDAPDVPEVQKNLTLPNGIRKIDHLLLFRIDQKRLNAYVKNGGDYQACEISDQESLMKLLPTTFRINAHVGLPESVPIGFLAGDSNAPSWFEKMGRRQRVALNEEISDHNDWFADASAITKSASSIASAVSRFFHEDDEAIKDTRMEEVALARTLLLDIANIDRKAFIELQHALANEKDAYVNSMIEQINSALAKNLNFPRWWVQDRDFQIRVSPRECDLVFTIMDRTGGEYAFNERSSGLKYFLSYYIQYLAYRPKKDGATPEILLMDEPDAYLSSQGQQDLLKLFSAYSCPQIGNRPPVQVVYVTHSPFLIDKNHAERIRVLEKGVDDEGTRVVRDASKNHYEPLRSAFGAFVGETTFIGNCNLVVEGPADQILIAGVNTYLRNRGVKKAALDLNHVTIVPAGSASHVPYIVYLARGRDVVQPAVVVLLDSDEAGKTAAKGLKRGGPRNKQILKPEFVLQVGDLEDMGIRLAPNQSLLESEDLVPLEICIAATRRYFKSVFGVDVASIERVNAESVAERLDDTTSVFDALQAALGALDPPQHLEKMGFARSVVEVVNESEDELESALTDFCHNMEILLAELSRLQRAAERDHQKELVSGKINRLKDAFLQDHVDSATREDVSILFEDIEAALDDSIEGDAIRLSMQHIRRDHSVDTDVTSSVADFPKLKWMLDELTYAGRMAVQVDMARQQSEETTVVATAGQSSNLPQPSTAKAECERVGDDTKSATLAETTTNDIDKC